jgi:lysophospholipase L1-like esterase
VPTTDAAVTPPPHEDLGAGDGSDVITMGDSWMSLGLTGIEQSLRAAGKNYRNYAVAGTTLAGSIPGQYDQAKRGNPDIKTVIMTGGGNDIMFSGGCNTAEACEQSVMMIVMMLNTLWTKMSADGVKDVIYINYSRDAGTAPAGTRPTEPPPPPAICATGPIRCHSLQTTDLVMGQLLDGIHPTSAANDRIVTALIALMEAQGVRR